MTYSSQSLNSFGYCVITKLTAFSLNFEIELVLSMFSDLSSTHTNKFETLNVYKLSSLTMLTIMNGNDAA